MLTRVNTLNEGGAAARLSGIRRETEDACRQLSREPAIARVVAENEYGERQTYFVTRSTPVLTESSGAKMVGYRAPLGRLAALPLQTPQAIATPSGTREFIVVEKAVLRPRADELGWDAEDTRVEVSGRGPRTIASLRAYLAGLAPEEVEDLLATMLAQDAVGRIVTEGFQRAYLRSVSLRENPVLDQVQDEVFRLPLDERLVLVGPPGSGKTTTLIKRLGQKLDLTALDSAETAGIARTRARADGHSTSWLMFSPTDLLKAFVKEAFSQEGIAAPDQRIQTWADRRHHLGRRVLPILSSQQGRGTFVLREHVALLRPEAIERPIAWYEAFETWQQKAFWVDLRDRATRLTAHADPAVALIGRRIQSALGTEPDPTPPLGALLELGAGLADRVSAVEQQARSVAQKAVNVALAADRDFVNRLGGTVASLAARLDPDGDEPDDDDDDAAETMSPRAGPEASFAAYLRFVKTMARAEADGRPPRSGSPTSRLSEWLGDRIPARKELAALGEALRLQGELRRFINPVRRYVLEIPRRYGRFRREEVSRNAWYLPGTIRSTDLTPPELDGVILAMLRAVRELSLDPQVGSAIGDQRFEWLRDLRDLWVSQVLVDEATDFSPIQLRCMAGHCDPALDSFLACGDFNQRTTRWGSRSDDDLKWVFPDIRIRKVTTTYRHSRRLNDLAALVASLSGDGGEAAGLPEHVVNEGVSPICGFDLADHASAAEWIARRLDEIESLSSPLPTIAVLVPSEADVRPVADALNLVLEERNLRAVPCTDGRFVGQDNDIRVFDVRHIKGLEFEAVFFLGLDRLVQGEPDLFGKYLYVGATRAATYLGLTVGGPSLPMELAALDGSFGEDWRV